MIEYENLLKNTRAYKTIMNDKEKGTLSHCIMIISEDEIACNNLCTLICRSLLCKQNSCGKCKDCLDVENGLHVDCTILNSYNKDGIQEFISKCFFSSENGLKVNLIRNFELIEIREQNRLLKLLEEPVENSMFILGVTKISGVLDTIKSRATKVYIENFSREDLENELKNKVEDYEKLNNAIKFSDGSITKTLNILKNEKFIDAYNITKGILKDMQNSTMVVDMIARLDLEEIGIYLDALENIIKQILEYSTKQNFDVDDDIIQLSEKYNIQTLVNINDLVIDARKKVEQYCNPEGVINSLLMGILEVKYKCR